MAKKQIPTRLIDTGEEEIPTELILVQNFLAELERLLPGSE